MIRLSFNFVNIILSFFNSALGIKLKRNPKCLRIQIAQPEGTYLDDDKWDKVKLEILGGAFENNPGCLVTYTEYAAVDENDFIRVGAILKQYSLTEKSKMLLVVKDKWSRTELDDIANDNIYFSSNMLWMLPNMDKIISLNEAEQVGKFLCNLNSLCFESDFTDKGEWEAIGCKGDDQDMTWTNPSTQRVDLVVENLKKLCSDLKIELEEM